MTFYNAEPLSLVGIFKGVIVVPINNKHTTLVETGIVPNVSSSKKQNGSINSLEIFLR
jgi:hypothetical protein